MSIFIAALKQVCEDVKTHSSELNKLDGYAGDGDLGVTASLAADAIIRVTDGLDGVPLPDVLKSCGSTLAREAPSTTGTLVATGLLRAARAAAEGEHSVAALLEAARAGIAERGGAQPGSKTMLDALAPAAAAAADAGADPVQALRAAAEAANAGARETAAMTARHGRAGWLAERSKGHEDAGARLVAIALCAAAEAAKLKHTSN